MINRHMLKHAAAAAPKLLVRQHIPAWQNNSNNIHTHTWVTLLACFACHVRLVFTYTQLVNLKAIDQQAHACR
jgi:glyoxylate utilization-related uncharacterized protein